MLTPMIRRLLLAVVMMLVVAGPANANPMAKYERAGFEYFGAAPDCPEVQYMWTNGEPFAAAARAELGGCRMWIDWPFWHSIDPAARCAIYMHEYAHWLGYEHDLDDGDGIDRIFVVLGEALPPPCLRMQPRILWPAPPVRIACKGLRIKHRRGMVIRRGCRRVHTSALYLG